MIWDFAAVNLDFEVPREVVLSDWLGSKAERKVSIYCCETGL